jgi:hypothetical protein
MRKATARRMAIVGAAAVVALLATTAPQAVASCASPVNQIEGENCLPGTSSDVWDFSGGGDSSIQGFATDISVNRGGTVHFKVDTDSQNYKLDIYRMGWYGGDGARLQGTVQGTPRNQPPCATDDSTGRVHCENWLESAAWPVPATAVSGIYFAHLVSNDGAGENHIVFVVRNDASTSGLFFQTSDTTWQAYNAYGGRSLYTGGPGASPSRAYKVSYDRPFTTRGNGGEDWVFNAEYPMVRWLERNAYDVSYTTGVDSDRRGALIRNHKVFLSVGHDEYWSGVQRTNVEAARDAGVSLAFFSGNEVFWKTRWEDGNRTLVSYKETHANQKIDPTATWTGTWRDPRSFNPQGGRPENALTGTVFTVNAGTTALQVPAADGQMRLWRNTSVATQSPGDAMTLAGGTIGYEWDEDLDNGWRPAGLFRLSTTDVSGVEKLQDYGSTYATGNATHHLTLYRDTNGTGKDALVFGAGTVQWSWGLDGNHDRGSGAPSQPMQQATLNLFADMGAQPGARQADLAVALPSTDAVAPTARITTPAAGPVSTARVTIAGTATDAGGGRVAGVEVSTNNGATWHPATGRASWQYEWTPPTTGKTTLRARAVDDSGNLGAQVAVAVDVGGRNCPCTLFGGAFSGAAQNDSQPIEVGTRFRPDSNGWIQALWYYDATAGGPAPVGHLWRADGTQLAQVQFPATAGTGWQRAVLPARVPVSANTTYVASYAAADGVYAATENYFSSPLNAPPLHADVDAGVFKYGLGFPTDTYHSSNYWADAEFNRPAAPQPPAGSSGGPNGPVAHPSRRETARARVKPRRVRANRRGVFRLKVQCAGREDGCRVRLRIRLGRRDIAVRTVAVGGGGAPRTVKVRLRRSDRRKLAAKDKLRLTAVASVRGLDGRRTVTRTRITLLAPRGRR